MLDMRFDYPQILLKIYKFVGAGGIKPQLNKFLKKIKRGLNGR